MLRNLKYGQTDRAVNGLMPWGFRVRPLRLLGWAVVLGSCLSPSASAVEGQPAAKIEEDWEVVIGEPNAEETAPQLYVVTSPTGDLSGQYAVFEINNVTLPDFYGGGLQFQTWWGDQATGEAHHSNFSSLSTGGETITFTVRMSLYPDSISFRIKNGQSQTWGPFGVDYSLRILQSTSVATLGGYNPDNSAKWSRVGFGLGRVTKFVLKQVRYYDSNGNLLSTDTTERDALVEEPQ